MNSELYEAKSTPSKYFKSWQKDYIMAKSSTNRTNLILTKGLIYKCLYLHKYRKILSSRTASCHRYFNQTTASLVLFAIFTFNTFATPRHTEVYSRYLCKIDVLKINNLEKTKVTLKTSYFSRNTIAPSRNFCSFLM